MTIAEARSWVREYARGSADDEDLYPAARIDRAIQFVGSRFVRKTRCTRTTSNLVTVADTATVTLAITNFRPEYLIRAYIPSENDLTLISHAELLEMQEASESEGVPEYLAFLSATEAHLYPTPDAVYTGKLIWTEPFTSWTVGGAPSPDSFNIVDEQMKELLTYGVPAALQHNETEHMYGSESWKKYLEFERECAGIGGMGARVANRVADDE